MIPSEEQMRAILATIGGSAWLLFAIRVALRSWRDAGRPRWVWRPGRQRGLPRAIGQTILYGPFNSRYQVSFMFAALAARFLDSALARWGLTGAFMSRAALAELTAIVVTMLWVAIRWERGLLLVRDDPPPWDGSERRSGQDRRTGRGRVA